MLPHAPSVARTRGAVWTAVATVGALLWTLLVAASPPGFFAWASVFGLLWLASSALAAPAGLAARLRPAALDVCIGGATGLALYLLSRLFLAVTCGGLTDALCAPVSAVLHQFEARAPFPALSLLLVLAPAEELYWRGVVQARLTPRIGAARSVAVAACAPALLTLAAGEPVLALATLPTYAVWGGLAALRGRLFPGLVSHATWSTLVAVIARPM